ncbi:kinase-like protein [Pseudovirgaria hyperparasitica]|uniref:Kinase-like protein n=1 Tax=Pseudovirgaria hyperparasitica TaxID=470096 RepID=A0A6A6VWK7_9PEZI|nr:kinase-like protein [Pseudovirgaria hyperparasitica]KAF2754239.1 kinase-like protein [Pseudovirgaria hyperparasitica]
MPLRIGQVLQGARGVYELLQPLKGSSVFKAKVLSSSSSAPQSKWAVVKTAGTDDERMCLRREYRNYSIPAIASSPHIRAMCDTIPSDSKHEDELPCLVFEWMDVDLRSVYAIDFRSRPALPRAVSKAVLSALHTLKTLDAVHTDVNPNNIFITNADSDCPVVKLGDLGVTIKDSYTKQRAQSLPCRAPEVWQGYSCRHASDVWSLAVTLTTKLSPLPLFGHLDKIIEGETEAWCIAKLICLVGPIGQPINPAYEDEFALARQLAVMDHPLTRVQSKLVQRGHWRTELEYIPDPPVPRDLLDFIGEILVMDPEKRPTAAQALQHPYLQAAL